MSVNPQEIKSWSEAATAALATMKAAIGLLPSGKKKEAEKAIELAERDLQLAQASAAKELGFELCFRHWPPGIMVLNDKNIFVCHDCGKPHDMGLMEQPKVGAQKDRPDTARSGLSRPL